MNNPPRRHHYIPQFFSKAWVDEKGNLSMYDKTEENKAIKVKTRDFGLEKDLYELNSQIESFFITPFIDNLSNSINYIRNNKWDEFPDEIKNDLYKFIILLDARNPISIKKMREAISDLKVLFLNLLEYTFSIDEITKREIKFGLDNGVIIFMMIAMQEIGIQEQELSKISDEKIKNTLKFCFKLVESARSYLPKPYYFDRFYDSFFVDELICEEDKLITSDRAISRRGAYDSDFTLLINISPKKGYFISNEESLIQLYKSLNHDQKIIMFNDSIKRFSTRFIIKK